MPGYVIGETEVRDQAAIGEYIRLVGPTVEKYGGRFAAAGPVVEVLEGTFHPTMTAVIVFDDVDAAKRWYDSEEYRQVRPLRQHSGTSNVIVLNALSA